MELDIQKQFADNLKILRKSKHLSQTAMAELINVSRSSYAQYESGDRIPDIITLYNIAQVYNIKMDCVVKMDGKQVIRQALAFDSLSYEESRLLHTFNNLSQFSKGRLMERAEDLWESDMIRNQAVECKLEPAG